MVGRACSWWVEFCKSVVYCDDVVVVWVCVCWQGVVAVGNGVTECESAWRPFLLPMVAPLLGSVVVSLVGDLVGSD